MHEDFDTEGSIPSSVAAGVPDIPWAVIPADRGKAGLLQNCIRGAWNSAENNPAESGTYLRVTAANIPEVPR